MTTSNDSSVKSNDMTDKSLVIDSDDYMGRAAIVLTCLGNGKNEITEISKSTKLVKSTVHRMLTKLVSSGFAVQDPATRRYFLGPLITRFSSTPQITHQYLILHAINEMERLSQIFGETIALGVLVGFQHMRLHIIQSKYSLSIVQGTNWSIQPFSFKGASMKVLMAQVEDEELEKIFIHANIKTTEEHTLKDREAFFKQIGEIRQQGYAISRGETIPASMALSVPIKNYTFPLCLSVIGLESRQAPRIDETICELKVSAQNISNDILISSIHTNARRYQNKS